MGCCVAKERVGSLPAAGRGQQVETQEEQELRLLREAERLYQELEDYAGAEEVYRRVLKMRERRLGKGCETHLQYVWVLQDVASCMLSAGRAADAEPIFRQVLLVRREQLGPQDSNTMWTMSSLANCCTQLFKFAEAVSLYQDLVHAEERDGVQPSTLINLGQCHLNMTKPALAKECFQRALAIMCAQGAPQEELINVEELLCSVMVDQGLYADAEKKLTAIKRQKEALGLELLYTDLLLANVLYYNSRVDEALQLYHSCLERSRQSYGEFHENTLACTNNLANAQLVAGDHASGLRTLQKAVEDVTRELGPCNPMTWDTKCSLAGALTTVGRLHESLRLWEETLQAMKVTMHPEHTRVLTTTIQLANVQQLLSQFTESEERIRECLKLLKHYQGEEHPTTLGAMQALSNTLLAQGKLAEAETLARTSAEVRALKFGEDHLETLGASNDLANVWLEMGRFEDAAKVYLKTWELRVSRSGEMHPETLSVSTNLGACKVMQGKYQEAEPWNRKQLRFMSEVYGEAHPHTLFARENLINTLRRCGKLREAMSLSRVNVRLRAEVLSPENYLALESRNTLGLVLHKLGRKELQGDDGGADAQQQQQQHQHQEPDDGGASGSGAAKEEAAGEQDTTKEVTAAGDFAGRDLGNAHLNEGVSILQEVLDARRRTLGSAHVMTLTSMYCVAKCYLYHGRTPAELDQGLALVQHCLSFRESLLGDNHPDRWRAMGMQARLKHRKAELLEQQQEQEQEQEQQQEQQQVRAAGGDPAELRREAKARVQEAVEGLESLLGAEHPSSKCWKKRADEF